MISPTREVLLVAAALDGAAIEVLDTWISEATSTINILVAASSAFTVIQID